MLTLAFRGWAYGAALGLQTNGRSAKPAELRQQPAAARDPSGGEPITMLLQLPRRLRADQIRRLPCLTEHLKQHLR
jgi:hypothetical protein